MRVMPGSKPNRRSEDVVSSVGTNALIKVVRELMRKEPLQNSEYDIGEQRWLRVIELATVSIRGS
jgi:hypothetical protein